MSYHLEIIKAGDVIPSDSPSAESLQALKMCKKCDHAIDRHRIRQTHTIPNPVRHTAIWCDRCQAECHALGNEVDEPAPPTVQSHWIDARLRRAGFGR